MGIGSEGIGDSSPEETRDGDGLSGAPESEPDLAPTSGLEGAEADRISAPPERQEPELAPANESENRMDGEGSTPPEYSDSSGKHALGQSETWDNRSIGQNASPFDRLRDAFNEAHDQDAREPDKPWNPFGDVPIVRVHSDDQLKQLKKASKEIREIAGP